MSTVETVRGPVDVSALGPTLAHEHIAVVSVEFEKFFPELSWGADGREAALRTIVGKLQDVRDRGITTIVDCTAYFHGRDIDLVKEANDQVDINLIMSTGIYTYDFLPFHVQYRPAKTAADDILTKMFIREITQGIGDSGIKAQMIKTATDRVGFTDNNVRILRAAARASAETGVPITAHTHPADGQAPRLLEILADEGADVRKVVVSHSGDTGDLEYLRTLMNAGAIMGDDRFGLSIPGTPAEDERIDVLAALCGEGYSGRIVLSHDHLMYCDWFDSVPVADIRTETWVPTRVSDVILPALRARGVSEADIEALMVSTPASMFAGIGS